MKVKLENWLHNSKPRQYEWKNEKEALDRINCNLEKTYTTEEEIKRLFPEGIDKIAKEVSDRLGNPDLTETEREIIFMKAIEAGGEERKELFKQLENPYLSDKEREQLEEKSGLIQHLSNENITIWKTANGKLNIEIMVGFPCDCSEYYETLTVEGEMQDVFAFLKLVIPTRQESEQWIKERWMEEKELRDYLEARYSFKPITVLEEKDGKIVEWKTTATSQIIDNFENKEKRK